MSNEKKRLMAYVGCNHVANFEGGGISVFEVSADGTSINFTGSVPDRPKRAGYLAYAPKAKVLYAVDERKSDGRGPIKPPSNISAWRINPDTGQLTFLNAKPSLGSCPAAITVLEENKSIFIANHAFFD